MSDFSTDRLPEYLDASPFIRFLGLTVEHSDRAKQEISLRMPLRPELERHSGTRQFHGGPIAALIDTVGDFAVALGVRGPVPTINFRVDYLRPSTGAYLIGVGRVRRVGKSIAVADVDVFDDQGRLCAIGRGCYAATAG